jgi:hypothetical protein
LGDPFEDSATGIDKLLAENIENTQNKEPKFKELVPKEGESKNIIYYLALEADGHSFPDFLNKYLELQV